MFNIEINFLRDRQSTESDGAAQPVADYRWVIGGGVVAAVLFAGTALAYFSLQSEDSRLKADLGQLENREKELDKQLALLNQSEKTAQEIDAQTVKLLELFVSDVPVSAILEDIKQRTPLNVRIDSLTQQGKKVLVDGQAAASNASASAFDPVNDFVLKLQESPYLADKGVTLKSIKLDPPNKDVKVDLAKYQIELALTPETALTLQESLQQSGAEGLLARISVLKEQGLDPAKLQAETQPKEGAQPK